MWKTMVRWIEQLPGGGLARCGNASISRMTTWSGVGLVFDAQYGTEETSRIVAGEFGGVFALSMFIMPFSALRYGMGVQGLDFYFIGEAFALTTLVNCFNRSAKSS